MATMVKEKKREKKKSKEKTAKPAVITESPTASHEPLYEEPPDDFSKVVETTFDDSTDASADNPTVDISKNKNITTDLIPPVIAQVDELPQTVAQIFTNQMAVPTVYQEDHVSRDHDYMIKEAVKGSQITFDNSYREINSKLERMCIPATLVPLCKEQELSLEAETAYYVEVKDAAVVIDVEPLSSNVLVENVPDGQQELSQSEAVLEDLVPSAPMLDIEEPQEACQVEFRVSQPVPKLISMPLEEAIQLFGGAEIAKVMEISKKEEAAVDAGPLSGPEHPLVDLLSTFKRSLILVEQEQQRLNTDYEEQSKQRRSLWKITQKHINECVPCSCSERVWFKATYEEAELQKQKLPVARLRLEGWLRELQDSYCHHLHAANLAHCQIEQFVSETMESHASEIREALSLILQAFKLSGTAPPALGTALRSWATSLASALLQQGERHAPLEPLLFLIHHLFRQNRSVRWATRVIDMHVGDNASAARTLAVLDVLLTRPGIESAVECMEDKDEEWEEVDKDGSGGAVSDRTLRETDMLALLAVFPLQQLLARILLFPDNDIRSIRSWQWGSASNGRDVVRACCGCRALLHVLRRACDTHAQYARVRCALYEVATRAMWALWALHEQSRSSYTKEMELKIQAELEAVFVGGLGLRAGGLGLRAGGLGLRAGGLGLRAGGLLPAALLSPRAARDYCMCHIAHAHAHDASTPMRVASLSAEVPACACDVRVRSVAQAAIDRPQDYELARIVVDFLFTTGVKKSNTKTTCKDACRLMAREQMPKVLAVHKHLYALALLLVAETNTVEKLEPAAISCLAVGGWRPQPGEARAVAADWARRCPQLLPPLLTALDYTPHTGLSLETQLTIGSWLSEQVSATSSPSSSDEWLWQVFRKLRCHRTCWGLPPEAPAPEEPTSLLAKALALMASSWGHCVPLICSEGVSALCALAAARVADAVHCLGPVMLVLAHSHDSIALTDKFSELFTLIVNASPGLMQRALGRGGCVGADALARLVREQLAEGQCGGVPRAALVRAWLAALWRPSLLPAMTLLDGVLSGLRQSQLDEYVTQLARAQDAETLQQLALATRLSAHAPLLCCAALGATLAQRELLPGLHARLAHALHAQRLTASRIHVDNALQLIGARIDSSELVVYRCCLAALAAPPQHPAQLLLWRLLLQLFLQRPQLDTQNTTPPIGPLFFSGLIKSRCLAQMRRKLQDTIKYHHTEAATLNEAKPTPKPSTSSNNIVIEEPQSVDGALLLTVSLDNLTSEPEGAIKTDSDLSDRNSREEKSDSNEGSPSKAMTENANLIAYHVGAEKMLSAYLQWLEEGERTTAAPHQAEISRFIPEQALEAAFKHWSRSRLPPAGAPSPPPAPAPPPAPPQRPQEPFDIARNNILRIGCRARSRSRKTVKSPVGNVDFADTRSLLTLVDQHLKSIVMMSKSWCSDVSRISTLDDKLWKLACELRVSRPPPVLRRKCDKCGHSVSYAPPGREWCRSIETEKGIIENRDSAKAAIRQLARARPQSARTAVALLTIARRIQSKELASNLCELAWRAAAAAGPARAPAADTLAAFFEMLAERWLSNDGHTCAAFIRACAPTSALQRALYPALVAPQRCSPHAVGALHAALLHTRTDRRTLFSALSKFDLSRWAPAVDSAARLEVLQALCGASGRLAADAPADGDLDMLLELLGVQVSCACTPAELRVLARSFANMTVEGSLQLAMAPHIVRAAERCAPNLSFDELGHLLRDLGVIWWEARAGLKGSKRARPRYASYAPHAASLLCAVHRALVAAAQQLSYAPERVATNAWLSLLESWSPWILPHSTEPLLPSVADDEAYTPMVKRFHDAVSQVTIDCPGTEEYLLSQIFEWTVQTYLGVQGASSQECRVQMSALLASLAGAPWPDHQWLRDSSLQALLQVCQRGDKEMCSWCASCLRGQTSATWLRDVTHSLLPKRLALLLYLFSQGQLQMQTQTLEEAMAFPWQRLPEAALEQALDAFFMPQHSAVPYHELPQFRVLLAASELYRPGRSGLSTSPASRQKRARCVSACVRAASGPARARHAARHAAALLDTLTAIAPHLESSEGEMEDLLGRAAAAMCVEPGAAAALPVWVSWTLNLPAGRLLASLARAVASLTAFEYFAPLADAVARACMRHNEGGGWALLARAWAHCPWVASPALCARARLHAAYAALRAHAPAHADVRAALLALLAADIDFVANEIIVAVWICAACRLVLTCGFEGSEGECRNASVALLTRWAEQTRRSLLQIVTLHAHTDRPQPKHRLLCLFALCVLSLGSEAPARAYEPACAALLGAGSDAAAWACAPHARRLPRLAARLYPDHHHYFQDELELAPEDPV